MTNPVRQRGTDLVIMPIRQGGRNGGDLVRRGRGRPKGSANRTTSILKNAIMLAAEECGTPEWKTVTKKVKRGRQTVEIEVKELVEGEGGLLGYLKHIALTEPKSFVTLLARVLPIQVKELEGMDDEEVEEIRYRTAQEIKEELERRGIPVIPRLE